MPAPDPQAKQFEHKIIRACPECRQTSDYICPSRFWVETVEEKERLLGDYKKNLGQKECKYFNKGVGECPFGNKCFYQHADKDGRTVDVGPPKKPLRRADRDGNLTLVQRLLLYDFLEVSGSSSSSASSSTSSSAPPGAGRAAGAPPGLRGAARPLLRRLRRVGGGGAGLAFPRIPARGFLFRKSRFVNH